MQDLFLGVGLGSALYMFFIVVVAFPPFMATFLILCIALLVIR